MKNGNSFNIIYIIFSTIFSTLLADFEAHTTLRLSY